MTFGLWPEEVGKSKEDPVNKPEEAGKSEEDPVNKPEEAGKKKELPKTPLILYFQDLLHTSQ